MKQFNEHLNQHQKKSNFSSVPGLEQIPVEIVHFIISFIPKSEWKNLASLAKDWNQLMELQFQTVFFDKFFNDCLKPKLYIKANNNFETKNEKISPYPVATRVTALTPIFQQKQLVFKLLEILAKQSEEIKDFYLAIVAGYDSKVEAYLEMYKTTNYFVITEAGKIITTPTHVAAQFGRDKTLQLIFKLFFKRSRSVIFHVKDKDGYTPLHLAIINGHEAVMDRLIQLFLDYQGLLNDSIKLFENHQRELTVINPRLGFLFQIENEFSAEVLYHAIVNKKADLITKLTAILNTNFDYKVKIYLKLIKLFINDNLLDELKFILTRKAINILIKLDALAGVIALNQQKDYADCVKIIWQALRADINYKDLTTFLTKGSTNQELEKYLMPHLTKNLILFVAINDGNLSSVSADALSKIIPSNKYDDLIEEFKKNNISIVEKMTKAEIIKTFKTLIALEKIIEDSLSFFADSFIYKNKHEICETIFLESKKVLYASHAWSEEKRCAYLILRMLDAFKSYDLCRYSMSPNLFSKIDSYATLYEAIKKWEQPLAAVKNLLDRYIPLISLNKSGKQYFSAINDTSFISDIDNYNEHANIISAEMSK